MISILELLIPGLTGLRWDVLEALPLRCNTGRHPLVGIVISAPLVFFKVIDPLRILNLSHMLQQALDGPIRRRLLQRHTKGIVDQHL